MPLIPNRVRILFSNLFTRGFHARKLRRERLSEQKAYATGNFDRTVLRGALENYNKTFSTDFTQQASAAIRGKGHCNVLDIGCGAGLFLRGLKNNFGEKITTAGTGITRIPKLDRVGIDHYHTGLVIGKSRFVRGKKEGFPSKFDLIVGRSGETQNLHLPELVGFLKGKLNRTGTAFIDAGMLGVNEQGFIAGLEKSGFNVETVGRHKAFEKVGHLLMLKITHK